MRVFHDKSDSRIIAWFSCGEASAVTAKLAVDKYGDRVRVVYCNTSKSEDEDNLRFRRDIEEWIGLQIRMIDNSKYATVDEVFEARRYLAGIKGAPCTGELKKVPRLNFQHSSDTHLFGFTHDEGSRISDFEYRNPSMNLEWILDDQDVSKADCRRIISAAGIETPLRYRQGFINNNCKCCVKATSLAYWILSRRVNPIEFARRADQSRRFGARLTRWKGKRIFLDEIPPDDQIPSRFLGKKKMENISCGPECGGNK